MIKKVINNKKGFTLVEIIVVLVILAILAAFLVPTLTGYIDKANERVAVAEARSFLMAAQSLASEEYAGIIEFGTAAGTTHIDQALALADLTGASASVLTATDGKVDTFTYVTTSGTKQVVYTREPDENTEMFAVTDL